MLLRIQADRQPDAGRIQIEQIACDGLRAEIDGQTEDTGGRIVDEADDFAGVGAKVKGDRRLRRGSGGSGHS
jgi:hypothetical protein